MIALGLYQYVFATETSSNCGIITVYGMPGSCPIGSASKDFPFNGDIEFTITMGLPSPYMQAFSADLNASGHTHYWYGYSNDLCLYNPNWCSPGVNTNDIASNNGGDLFWSICFNTGSFPLGSDVCFWGPGENYPDNDPFGLPISLSEQRWVDTPPPAIYNNFQYMVGHVVYSNNGNPLGDIESVEFGVQYRMVSIDGFNVPGTATVGVPFAIDWATEWSTETDYPRLSLSGPITCNQTGPLPNQTGIFPRSIGSTQCTLTGPGTATLTLEASGPVIDGVVGPRTVLLAKQVSDPSVIPSSQCGNGVVDSGEQCDLGNLNGQSCGGLGYTGGSLSCTGSCYYDTSACTSSGIGMISGYVYEDLNTSNCCTGVKDPGEPVFPGETVTLVKQPSGPTLITTSDSSGYFQFTGLTSGTYTLSHTVPPGFTRTTSDSITIVVP